VRSAISNPDCFSGEVDLHDTKERFCLYCGYSRYETTCMGTRCCLSLLCPRNSVSLSPRALRGSAVLMEIFNPIGLSLHVDCFRFRAKPG